jgi:hypothetical protein
MLVTKFLLHLHYKEFIFNSWHHVLLCSWHFLQLGEQVRIHIHSDSYGSWIVLNQRHPEMMVIIFVKISSLEVCV